MRRGEADGLVQEHLAGLSMNSNSYVCRARRTSEWTKQRHYVVDRCDMVTLLEEAEEMKGNKNETEVWKDSKEVKILFLLTANHG